MGLLIVFVAAVMTVLPHARKPKTPIPETAAIQIGAQESAAVPRSPAANSRGPLNLSTIDEDEVLTITVEGEPDLSRRYPVDSEGHVTFPLIGKVRAAGLTPGELTASLGERLRDGYLRDPKITVAIGDSGTQVVYVSGEVRSPGRIRTVGPVPIIQALTLAGSRSVAASDDMLLIRAGGEKTTVSFKDLGAHSDLLLNDGDTLFLPKAQTFFILGEVRHPGTYILDGEMTVAQAIALAGGVTPTGSGRDIKVTRVANGRRVTIDMKPADILRPNDTVQIPSRIF